MDTHVCAFCGFVMESQFVFCPRCGNKRAEDPLSMGKQIKAYMLSIFLPPFGLIPGIKYFRSTDEKVKRFGLTIIIVTAIATILTIWISIATFDQINKSVTSQLQQYNSLDY